MTSAKTLGGAAQAAPRHWNVDGLPEIEGGVLLVLWGSILAWHALWPSRLSAMAAGVLPLLLVALLLVADQLLLPQLKARITYPRVGYAQPRVAPYRRAAAAGLGAVAAAGMAAWIASEGFDGRHLPRALAGMTAVFLAFCATRFRLPRFFAYAAVAVVCGLALPREWPVDLGVGVLQAAVGAAAVAGGVRTLRRLLRTPIAEEP